MQLQQLEYFVMIADTGSLNRAAEKLFLTQPSLSKAIANLEEELNVQVFVRSKTGVELTEEGRKLYHYAKAILERTELIYRIGQNESEMPGLVTVSSYPIISMGNWAAEYYNTHSDPYVHINLRECRTMQLMENIENGISEIGFMMFNHAQHKEVTYTLRTKKLEFHELGFDTWYVNLGPAHPLYNRKEIEIREMLDYPFIRFQDDYFSNLTFFLDIDGIKLNSFKRVLHVNDTAAIISILRNTDAFRFGVGLSSEDFEAYGIRTIPIRNCQVRIHIGWVEQKKIVHTPCAQDFINLIEKKCSNLMKE